MKELKFNIQYIFRKKEFYLMILFLILIVTANVIFSSNEFLSHSRDFKETAPTALSLVLFSKEGTRTLLPICLLSFPILSSLIFSDLSWTERKEKSDYLLFNRLSYKKNIWVRFLLTIIGTFLLIFIALTLDYICLSLIFGNGNRFILGGNRIAFNLFPFWKESFLSSLSYQNPDLYIILCNAHVALTFALLAGVGYAFSFFIKQRLILYFITPVILMVCEAVFNLIETSTFSLRYFSPLSQLQLTVGNTMNAYILYFILFFISFITIILHLRKKDIL